MLDEPDAVLVWARLRPREPRALDGAAHRAADEAEGLARARGVPPGRLERFPWTMAGAFGLLHGFGFAGALAQVGLPSDETPSASLARVTIGVSNARRAGSLRAVLVTTAVLSLALGCSADAEDPKPPEIVVLLHGLARTDWSMKPLEVRLEKAGYVVENLHYGSMDQTPEEILAQLRGQLVACCSEASKLHFVTHSLGGILTRAYVAESRPENLGRVVMIAPPNKGSELADWIAGSELLSWTMGPTAVELGTDPDSLPNRLPPADFEVGIIAGTGSVNPFEGKVAGESDGTVSVESTKLEGMTDFITMPYSHTFIMQAEPVARQVVSFLQTGRFLHESAEGERANGPDPTRETADGGRAGATP